MDFVPTAEKQRHPCVIALGKYLARYGYLTDSPATDELSGELLTALQQFQRTTGLAESCLDEATCARLAANRCGGGRVHLGTPASSTRGGWTAWQQVGWSRKGLSYRFDTCAALVARSSISIESAQDAVRRAFVTWMEADVGLQFSETNTFADIEISWYFSEDDPECPFYGCQLSHHDHAHADYPGPNTLFGGPPLPIHFNADRRWVMEHDPSGLDVESVALHEIGHCLGLFHGPHGTVMEEFFWPGEQRRELDAWTRTQLGLLYGTLT